MKKVINLLFILAIGLPIPAIASDLAKEKRWSAQIVDALLVGEAVQLDAGGTSFLGIFTEASDGDSGQAAIVLHGIGVHPDWPEVVNPLRSELPEHGWATLSIQMPILANDAPLKDYAPLFDEVAPRIDAAVQFLQERGNRTIVLVGHSLGASMAATYLGGESRKGVDGLVAVGMSVIELDDRMNSALALQEIRKPVLDLYGSRDLDSVLDSARGREKAARKAGNGGYRQLSIEGADHFFIGLQDDLVRRVYGWLKTTFESGQS
jgi:pimeloyl-ACP methyl ester carboxylesterase